MQIYELTKTINEAGLAKSAYDFAKRQARNYMSGKTGLPADVFKNQAERDEDEARRAIAAKKRQSSLDASSGTTTTPEPTTTTATNTSPAATTTSTAPSPEQIRKQKQDAAAKVAQDQMASAPITQPSSVASAQSPEQIRKQKQDAAAKVAQDQMASTPATTATPATTTPTTGYKSVAMKGPAGQPLQATVPAPLSVTPTTKQPTAVSKTAIQPAVEPSAQQSAVGVKQINQLIPSIRTRDLNSIKKNIDAVLTKRQKPAATTATTSAVSNMATQLTNKPVASSTGGKITTTPTGLVHTAKPSTPAATTPQWTGRKSKVSAPPPTGAPTSAEYANLEKRLQQAMAAQGQTK